MTVLRSQSSAPGEVDARLVISLLGPGSVTLDGVALPSLSTPRVQRLLARLAFDAPDPSRRDRLAWELWPDSTEGQARTNLRKVVHDLRQPLPDGLLEIDGQTIRWRPDAPVRVDVAAFTAALARNDRAAAVEHYRGHLLPGCYDDWVLAERERLRRLAVDALASLAGEAETAGDDEAVVARARRLLELDPLHEPGYRLLMGALARRGDRSEALRVYHRCVEVLDEELGVAPEPATTAAYERAHGPAPRHASTQVAGKGWAFVGRHDERSVAAAAWRAASAGEAHLLLVTGEAGIGKTKLVEELARRVTTEGNAVAHARAYEAAGRPPWGPVVDWLRSDAVAGGLADLDEVWLVELTRLLPELRGRRPDLADASPAAADPARRRRLLDAVRRGLLASGRPLLLVLDDLQWCDLDTIDLCGFLLQSTGPAPVLIAATARDDEIDEEGPLARVRSQVASVTTVSSVALGRLSPYDAAEVAAAVGGRKLDPAQARSLWEETEGNPLFVVEAVRAGLLDEEAPRSAALTPTVQAVITARLRRLSTDARALLDIAAVIGREFTSAGLAAAAGRGEEEVADDLDELWHRRIIRERGAHYDFSHDKLREVVLAGISPARRRRLHRAAALALAQERADDLGPVSARVAAHYEAAGLDEAAVQAYEQAAEHAYRLFALDDGITLLQRGLRLLDRFPHGRARDETELRLRSALGVPLVARHGYGASPVRHNYERARSVHRQLGRRPSPPVLRGLALDAVVRCQFDRATELAEALVAEGEQDGTAMIEGRYVLGVTQFWRGDFDGAEDHLQATVDLYRPDDVHVHIASYGQDPRAVCLSRLALNRLFVGRSTEADDLMAKAIGWANELDHPLTTGYVRAYAAVAAALAPEDHDLGGAVGSLEEITAARHIGYFRTMARLLGGWRSVLAGRLGGIDAMREVTEYWRGEQQFHLTLGLSLLARSYLAAGDEPAARAAIDEALAWTQRTGQRYLLAELLRIDAQARTAARDLAAAGVARQAALEVAAEQGSEWLARRIRDSALEGTPPERLV